MAKNGLDSYEYCLQELEKENEELKQEIIDLKWQQESDYQMIEDAETLIYDNDFYKREMDKYKQALEEIKEIANEFNKVDKFGKSLHPEFYNAFEFITTKIDEAMR